MPLAAPLHAYEAIYSPAEQVEMDAARERRREAARQKIDSIIHGKTGGAPAAIPIPPKPLLASPSIPPSPSPLAPYRPIPPPISVPTAVVAAPTPLPVPVVVTTSAPAQPLAPMPWHRADSPPPAPELNDAPIPLAMPALPASEPEVKPMPTETPVPVPTPREGVVADKTYIVKPGFPPPPPSPPLQVETPANPSEIAGVTVLPEVGEAIEAMETPHAETLSPELSPETEKILDALPVDIIGRAKPKETPGELHVDRMDPAVELPDLETAPTMASSETKGLKVAVKKRPTDVNYELEKAYVALTAGNTEEAAAIYNEVLEIAPDNEAALFGLATTYHRVGLLDKARPVYGRLLKINPRHKEAINNFLVLVGEEAPERALEHMKHLEMENPEFAPIPAQMALLYAKIGDQPSAIASMQQAVNLSPENLVYKYNLAILYDQAGKPVEASMLYQQLLEARYRGEAIPAEADEIQQRLTFLLSNK